MKILSILGAVKRFRLRDKIIQKLKAPITMSLQSLSQPSIKIVKEKWAGNNIFNGILDEKMKIEKSFYSNDCSPYQNFVVSNQRDFKSSNISPHAVHGIKLFDELTKRKNLHRGNFLNVFSARSRIFLD